MSALITRRGILGVLAAPFVIKAAGILMPISSRHIAAPETIDLLPAPRPYPRFVAMGDSLTYGIGGETSAQILARMRPITRPHPAVPWAQLVEARIAGDTSMAVWLTRNRT